MKPLRLAYSTCPNDTFMFEAFINGRIPNEGFSFDLTLADIKELNHIARHNQADICKVSYFAFAELQDRYTLLNAGSALGRGCGPLLISPKKEIDPATAKVLIPGTDTTAHLLLQFYNPNIIHKEVRLFSEIMPALVNAEADAGVIIHESRFTYQDYGLHLIQDLGQYWEEVTGLPIPLGGIIARKELGADVIAKIDQMLQASIRYAFDHPEIVMPYVRSLAQEMDDAVMKAHIELYVNDYSLNLGTEGKQVIDRLLATAEQLLAVK